MRPEEDSKRMWETEQRMVMRKNKEDQKGGGGDESWGCGSQSERAGRCEEGKGNVTEALLQECQVEKSTKDKEIKLYHYHD